MIFDEFSPSRTRRTLTAGGRTLRALGLDGPLTGVLAIILCIGVLVVYSASGQNIKMVEALTFKKYDVNYCWGLGTHSNKQGGAIMPEMLRWLWRDYPRVDDPKDPGGATRTNTSLNLANARIHERPPTDAISRVVMTACSECDKDTACIASRLATTSPVLRPYFATKQR